MDKYIPKRIPIESVLEELGYVKWPPKKDGDECECGCKIVNQVWVFCKQHQPFPA
jgi:hypothetical protein